MPEMRRYVITQTRMVEVAANDPGDAVTIARVAFANGQSSANSVRLDGPMKLPEGIWGNTETRIRITGLNCEEK